MRLRSHLARIREILPIHEMAKISTRGGILHAVLLMTFMGGSAHAIITSDGDGTHIVEPGVAAFGINLDGVVSLDQQGFGFGTGVLISDTHVLTAAHVIRENPFLFSARFDLPGGAVTIPVVGYALYPGFSDTTLANDLAVLELAEAAPLEAPRYPLYTGTNEVGKTTVIAGYGRKGSGATGASGGLVGDGNKRAGLNRIDATGQDVADLGGYPAGFDSSFLLFDFDSGSPANDFTTLFGSGDLGFGNDEVGLGDYDAGGPLFIEVEPGEFRLAGINSVNAGLLGSFSSFDYAAETGSWGEVFRSMRVSSAISFINGAMAGNGMRRLRIFNDGEANFEENTSVNTLVRVEDWPGLAGIPTVLTLGFGASVASTQLEGIALEIRDFSEVFVNDGTITGYPAVQVVDYGYLVVSGGRITALPNTLFAFFSNSVGIRANGNSETIITGGTITGDADALAAIDDSFVTINGGTLIGGNNAARIYSSALVSGGSFQSSGNGINTDLNGYLVIVDGTFQGDDNGGLFGGNSKVEIIGGSFLSTSDALRSDAEATVKIQGGSFTGDSIGLRAMNASKMTVGGGTVTGQFALWSPDEAEVTVSGGEFSGVLNDLRVQGSSTCLISGGNFTGESVGLAALDSARVLVTGGQFDNGSFAIRSTQLSEVGVSGGSFKGSTYAFVASEESLATINGGSFEAPRGGIIVSNTAKAEIRGGTFKGPNEDGMYVTDSATVDIFAGDFQGLQTDIYTDSNAVVRIYGYDFNRPLGEVVDSSGTISGTYFDGTPFSIFFARFNNSIIELVSTYESWAMAYGLEGPDALPTADPNGNAYPNIVELVFGGNPAPGGSSPIILTSSLQADLGNGDQRYFKMSYPLTESSISLGAIANCEYSLDLSPDSWTLAQDGVDGVIIQTTIDGFAPDLHQVEVWLPASLAPDGRLFTRVSADFP